MIERHLQLVNHLSRLLAPLAAGTSEDATGHQRIAALPSICLRTLEQVTGESFADDRRQELYDAIERALVSAYTDFYEQQRDYDSASATAGLTLVLGDAARVTVMEMLWAFAKDSGPLDDELDWIQRYTDDLGLIWDRGTNVFTVNAWAAHNATARLTSPPSASTLGGTPAAVGRSMDELLSCVRTSAGALEIQKVHDAGTGARAVLIYQNSPTDADVWRAIAASLRQLVEQAGIRLVMTDGATSVIDTSPAWRMSQSDIHRLLEDGKVSPAECCHIRLKGQFTCIGVDDSALYRLSAERFMAGDHFGVNELEFPRAVKITGRVLDRMAEIGAPVAALQLTGHLPGLVADRLEEQNVSFVVLAMRKAGIGVEPKPQGASDTVAL